jgi:hypothetical protein
MYLAVSGSTAGEGFSGSGVKDFRKKMRAGKISACRKILNNADTESCYTLC